MRIHLRHNADRMAAAFRADAQGAAVAVDRALQRGAIELARESRRRAPKARSTLTQSILTERLAPGRHAVHVNARYAGHVEEGTGPGGRPPLASVLDWMRIKGVTPRTPGMNTEDLARLIRRSIAQRGTPAQPFVQPSVDALRGRIVDLVDSALQRVIEGTPA